MPIAPRDGEFFTGKDVLWWEGGSPAAEEAMFLTRYARSVTVLVRKDAFSCAESVVEQVMAHESIRVRFNTELVEVDGDSALRRAVLRDTLTGRTETYVPASGETFGVFVFAGYRPASALARGFAEMDGQGYIVVDREQKTATDGIYAAGDVCVKNLRQVVTAVSDGAVAATSIERYAAEMQRKTGVRPEQPAAAVRQTASTEADDRTDGPSYRREQSAAGGRFRTHGAVSCSARRSGQSSGFCGTAKHAGRTGRADGQAARGVASRFGRSRSSLRFGFPL